MYLPSHFAEERPAVIHSLMRSHPLALVIVSVDGAVQAEHIPLLLCQDALDGDVLRGHVARANPLWRVLGHGHPALVVFQGPQAYISPSAYPAKVRHGKVVPTWNYAVVHVRGIAKAIDDVAWLGRFVRDLTDAAEQHERQPWAVDDAPAAYVQQQLKAIIGIEIRIDEMTAKFKLSQNRELADRAGVMTKLEADGASKIATLAALMRAP